jgi:choline transport protein
MGVDK